MMQVRAPIWLSIVAHKTPVLLQFPQKMFWLSFETLNFCFDVFFCVCVFKITVWVMLLFKFWQVVRQNRRQARWL